MVDGLMADGSGLRYRVQGLGCGAWILWFTVYDIGLRVTAVFVARTIPEGRPEDM